MRRLDYSTDGEMHRKTGIGNVARKGRRPLRPAHPDAAMVVLPNIVSINNGMLLHRWVQTPCIAFCRHFTRRWSK